MTETTVTASHFRVHFKEIANSVTRGEQACTVTRHGLPIGVLVSEEDAEFLRQHKWGKSDAPAAAPTKAAAATDGITLVHPELMPLDQVEMAYDLTSGSTDFEIQSWRYKAFLMIKGRTGKQPAPPFGPSG